jgi:hypothetical protein
VYPFPEKGEAGASIDSVGNVRVYVVTELKEPGNVVMVSASKEEVKGAQELGTLDQQRVESPYVSMSSLLPKLGTSLCSLAISNPSYYPSPPQPLCIHNSEFHSSFLSRLLFLRSVRRLLVTAIVVLSSPIIVTLMKEALSSSEIRFLQNPHGVTSQKTPFLNNYHIGSLL